MIVDVVKFFSHRLLPGGRRYHKLRFGPAAGCTIKLNFHHDLRLYLGRYEAEIQPHFNRLVKKGYTAFDAGGAGGYDALMISKLSGGGRVISLECESAAAAEMAETFRLNAFPIEAVQGFVSDRDTDGHLSLDAMARRFFVPDFIKIDIEGAEDVALQGAAHILSTRMPSMIIEVHGQDKETRCLEILKGHGYRPEIVDRRPFLREDRQLQHNRWLVCPGRDV